MRMLNRNMQEFRYKLLTSASVPVLDPDGFETGEYALVYSTQYTGHASISAATGEVIERAFGASVEYDRVLCASTDFGMDENSLLWIDDLEAESHDYIVKRIARSLNNVRFALAKVNRHAD